MERGDMTQSENGYFSSRYQRDVPMGGIFGLIFNPAVGGKHFETVPIINLILK